MKDYRICTMPDGNWFVSSIYETALKIDGEFTTLEELAKESGGEIDGYELGEILELFGVHADEDTPDPHNDLLSAINADPLHTQMLESIRNSVTP